MASNILLKSSAVANKQPTTSTLSLRELAVNTTDGKLYLRQGTGIAGDNIFTVNPWNQSTGGTSYNLSFLSGNVGIGTNSPQYLLDVNGSLNVSGTINNSSINDLYELDDVSGGCNGLRNTFSPTFNYTKVSITDPFKLLITVNGILQSAFKNNSDYVFNSQCLASKDGYTIDYSGNIKFTESVPIGSQIVIKTTSGSTRSSTRYYPFSPLDIVLY